MSYYITTIEEAKRTVADRRSKRDKLRPHVDRFILDRYGITNFSTKMHDNVSKSLNIRDNDKTFGVLARQIPGVSTEDVACHMVAHRMGFTPLPMAFSRDCFVVQSNDKKYRVHIPFVRWSRKGSLIIENQNITEQQTRLDTLNMVRMDQINIDTSHGGGTLPTYHRKMYQNSFRHFPGGNAWFDVSTLYAEFLAEVLEVKRFPETIWRQNREDDKDYSCESSLCTPNEARSLVLRPSAKWYYGFYLSLFLDGTFVLLETYDNDSGGVPEARKLFENEMNIIERSTGFKPLVVRTFPLEPDMLYVNQHILENPELAAVFLQEQKFWSDDTTKLTRWFADRAIQFRG